MNTTMLLMKLNSKAGTKEKIVRVLSENWPLTTKEIFNRLVKGYSHEISYQGVHKTLMELCEENLLEKIDSKFMLSEEWIDTNKKFFSLAQTRYTKEQGKNEVSRNFEGTIILEFDNYSRLVVWLAELFKSNVLVSGPDSTLVGYMRYGYWPLNFNFKDFVLLMKMLGKATKGYPIIKHKTPFDEWIMRQYARAGAIKLVFDKNMSAENDLFIQGDSIVEVIIQPEFEEYLKKKHEKIKNVNDLFQNFVLEKEKPAKIKVKITKNPELAKYLINEAMKKYFDRKDD